LGEFELVKKKIASMAAWTYAMEAVTYVTASLIDRGLEDYMLETAMLKVYTTEALWTIVNDSFQIHGGAAYFVDRPLERMLRDARINQIGEGANEVLISFIALVGMRGPGDELRKVADAIRRPWRGGLGPLGRFIAERAAHLLRAPKVPLRSPKLRRHGRTLGRLIRSLDHAVERTLIRHRQAVLDRQYDQERIAWAAMEIYASACVLSRLDADLAEGSAHSRRTAACGTLAAELFLALSARRVRQQLAGLDNNDDTLATAVATRALEPGEP
jgi:alkylation response protein AidB-like acyl-CoA dehydrogenase